MSEFANRIDSQRHILRRVNKRKWPAEPLVSLSSEAITRFSTANNLGKDCRLIQLLTEASNKLFFLANKSQEQVTEDYKKLSWDVNQISKLISTEVTKYS